MPAARVRRWSNKSCCSPADPLVHRRRTCMDSAGQPTVKQLAQQQLLQQLRARI